MCNEPPVRTRPHDLSVVASSNPPGWLIGRLAMPPFWVFWNEGDVWAGSGKVFTSRVRLLRQFNLLLMEMEAEMRRPHA